MDDDERLYWVWLTQIPSVGPVLQKRLLDRFHTPKRIYEAGPSEWAEISGIGPALVKKIRVSHSLEGAKRMMERVEKGQIRLLTYDDPLYPQRVKQEPLAPTLLYYRGHLRKDSLGVGVIGTRKCSSYGKQVAVQTSNFLAQHGVPVISGMAKGVEGYAHTACLKAGGYTIAIMGCGVDVCYPKEHHSLMEGIIENGVVLSSYPPGTRIHPHHFYHRNFLLSAWSSQLLIVEAGETSAALSTANVAKKMKREIWAVPGSIYSPESKGTHQLIAQGASIFFDPGQLLPSDHTLVKETSYPRQALNPTEPSYDLTPFERNIVERLKSSTRTIDELAHLLKVSQSELLPVLSTLELEGLIHIMPNHQVKLIYPLG